ncbi:MaoC family dehydratase N-terminal domain-containing protein [Pimelobacter simplex]|uniref:MaoC family dehydratase N-terminal domain-containing protein n=1 Tax=Nocardioides simplex TaxID=2045 RepID=UPI001933D4F6|nr:MaoC family dehydratase N-terminal domain-containing protein [Pimelobacter simplex]
MMTPAQSEERTEVIAAEPVESLGAMLDIEVGFAPGDPVPPLWHWLYLLDRRPESELGEDGHPVTGVPTPPGPGRRRMFGGGRVTTLGQLRIGEQATKSTSILRSVDKTGRSGDLTVVTVLHQISQDGEVVIREEQDILYRAPGSDSLAAAAPSPQPAPDGPQLSLAVDERLLFRFSALTYNAHRIHYDLDWVLREGYDGLVIHGPLLALMMGEHLRRQGIDLRNRTFAYRLLSPMTRPQTLTVVPSARGLAHGAEARSAAGVVCASSTLQEPAASPPLNAAS